MRTCSVYRTCVGVGERRVWCVGMFSICFARHVLPVVSSTCCTIQILLVRTIVLIWQDDVSCMYAYCQQEVHWRAWELECRAHASMLHELQFVRWTCVLSHPFQIDYICFRFQFLDDVHLIWCVLPVALFVCTCKQRVNNSSVNIGGRGQLDAVYGRVRYTKIVHCVTGARVSCPNHSSYVFMNLTVSFQDSINIVVSVRHGSNPGSLRHRRVYAIWHDVWACVL